MSGAVFRRRIARLAESGNLAWSAAAFIISLIVLLPIIALTFIAFRSSGDTWPHLVANVLPGALRRTLGLTAGVGVLSLLIGTGTAWLVTMYRFPGRRLLRWLLLLPPCRPDLHHRLLLSRAARLFRHRADKLARAVRLAKRAQLLVPRHQEPTRRDLRYERRALSLCVHHRAGKFRRAVGLRARG